MKTLDEIVDIYYNAVLKYESYLQKYTKNEEVNKYNNISKIDEMVHKIENVVKECYENECMPWRQIEIDIREGIKKDFQKREKIPFYLRAEDGISDSLSLNAEQELLEYYLKKWYDINTDEFEDKLEQEICDLYTNDSLDSEKYSKQTLELKEISMIFQNACKEVYNIYIGEYQFDEENSNKIDIELNNGRTMRINQTESDKIRCGIVIETLDENRKLEDRELISEGDFVMLINYYRYIKENDIKDEFINRDGLNDREEFQEEYEI